MGKPSTWIRISVRTGKVSSQGTVWKDPDTGFRYTQSQYEAALAKEQAEEQQMEVELDANGDIPIGSDVPDLNDEELPELPPVTNDRGQQLIAPPGFRGPREFPGSGKRPADEITPEGEGTSFINFHRRWQIKMFTWKV